ncbi:MAG: DUF2207 domain-containing protein [Treponema sp.]|nr:DUF2207 domain-containing protein [Candidatus Treponema equifaecale]
MKKFLILLVLAGLVQLNCFADQAGYSIIDYKFHGLLHENNSVSVTEEITVNFTEPRHGLYRTIPSTMHVAREIDGETKVLKYRNKIRHVSVQNENFEWEEGAIKIGDAGKTVLGKKRYVISYDYIMPDDRVDSGDLFFYSVLGSEWNVDIGSFSFVVDFEKALPRETEFKIYSGAFGRGDNALGVEAVLEGNSIHGRCYDIPANSAVTLYAELPEGYFEGAQKLGAGPVWFAAVVAILLCVYGLFKIFTTRKKTPIQTVEFYAPDGVSSAEIGYIIDRSSDDVDLISLLPYLAEKGFLEIEEKENDFILVRKLKDLPVDCPVYMRSLFKLFFKKSTEFRIQNLSESFVKKFSEIKKELSEEFVGERELYTGEGKAVFLNVICTLVFALMLAISGAEERLENLPFGIFPGFFLLVTGTILRSMAFKKNFHKKRAGAASVVLTCFSVIVTFGAVALASDSAVIPAGIMFFAAVLVNLVNLLNSKLIVPTKYNLEISGKLMGLKEFISKAEMPRLKALYEENPSYFYNILPFAMVFGLSDKWAKVAGEFSVPKPDWYRTAGYSDFSFGRMAASMNSSVRNQINEVREEMAKAAASSSGGHSGFSGGGGGGGGGGSW